MDFSAKRMALLAGIGGPEDRHDVVQEQVQQLNESIEARQLNEAEEEVRKAVRRTIQKMIAEGGIDLQEEEGYGITGGAMHVFEDDIEEDQEDIDQLEEAEAEDVAPPAAKAPQQRRLPRRGFIKIDAKLLRDKLTRGQLKMLGLEETNHLDEDTFHDEERHDDMEEVSLYEMEDGSMHMEMAGVRYHLQELEEVEIPQGATDANVGEDGETVEFSQKMEETE